MARPRIKKQNRVGWRWKVEKCVCVCSPTEKRLEQLVKADSWLAGSGVKP